MAHKILVVSPLHNAGTTAVSILLSQGLTYYNKKSMLLYTEPESLLPDYLGIENINDPTRSISQVVKLKDAGALSDPDILDYSYCYAKNSYLMNIADNSLLKADRNQIIRHVFNHTPTDVAVVDFSEDLLNIEDKALLDVANQVFIVSNPTTKHIERLKLWLNDKAVKDLENVYVIFNMYNEVIGATRQLAKVIGLPSNRVCQVHYNPWITRCCSLGQIQTILPNAQEYDPRVVNLRQDISEIIQSIEGCIVISAKKV